MRHQFKNVSKGFTLIELLVVIAIISLLVSILLPSLNKAKELAKKTLCATKLRAMGQAAHFYSGDYDGSLPGPAGSSLMFNLFRWTYDVGVQWYLIPYMNTDENDENFYVTGTGYMDEFVCPSNIMPQDMNYKLHYVNHAYTRDSAGEIKEVVFGYMSSAVGYRPGEPNYCPPSQLASIANCADTWAIEDGDYYNYPSPALKFEVPVPIHDGGRNVLWVDTHVSWEESELVEYSVP